MLIVVANPPLLHRPPTFEPEKSSEISTSGTEGSESTDLAIVMMLQQEPHSQMLFLGQVAGKGR